MSKTLVEIEHEAELMVDALDVVFSLSEPLLKDMGFNDAEVQEVYIRASRKLFQRRGGNAQY